jgi:hypothetical protein
VGLFREFPDAFEHGEGEASKALFVHPGGMGDDMRGSPFAGHVVADGDLG